MDEGLGAQSSASGVASDSAVSATGLAQITSLPALTGFYFKIGLTVPPLFEN